MTVASKKKASCRNEGATGRLGPKSPAVGGHAILWMVFLSFCLVYALVQMVLAVSHLTLSDVTSAIALRRRRTYHDGGMWRRRKERRPEDSKSFGAISCDKLFSPSSIVNSGDGCKKHQYLGWEVCVLPTIRFDPGLIEGSAGNESALAVAGRQEREEHYVYRPGSVVAARSLDRALKFAPEPYMRTPEVKQLRRTVRVDPHLTAPDKTTTVLVFRDTYANPCWSIMLLFQTWVVVQQMHRRSNVRVIWMDGYAASIMDGPWQRLLGRVVHFKNYATEPVTFRRSLVVQSGHTAMGNEAVELHDGSACHEKDSYLHRFRQAVLKACNVTEPPSRPAERVVTLLHRRPYHAHPRSKGEKVDRALHNVKETEKALRKRYPNCKIQSVSFEEIPFCEQLEVIVDTDVLVSVHGAGNVHVLFLPETAAVFEFFPAEMQGRRRFEFLSKARGLLYENHEAEVTARDGDFMTVDITNAIPRLPEPS